MFQISKSENTPLHVVSVSPTVSLTRKKLNLSTRSLNKVFILIISFFAICHCVTVYFDYGGIHKNALMKTFAKLFNLNSERGFPNLFSGLILLTASALLYFIYRVIHRSTPYKHKKSWQMLAFVFLYLCLDETFSIHEQLIPVTQHLLGTSLHGFLHWAWVVPYFFLLVGVVAYFWRFVFDLPTSTRKLFFLSGFIYVGGALVVEMIEGYTYEQHQYVINECLVLLQEVMEMAGIALFIYALLKYIGMRSRELTVVLKND
jgi:hypothetical protein